MRGKGFQGTIARDKGTTWGIAVALAALDGLHVLSIMPNAATEGLDDRQVGAGRVTQPKQYPGNRNCAPVIVANLVYEGITRDLAYIMGTAGVPATVDTTGKKHVLKIADQHDGIFSSIAYEYLKDTTVAEIPSFKSTKVTIRGAAGQMMEIEISGLGFDYKEDSVINTTATIDTVTLPANYEIALFKHALFRLNAQGAGALGAGDARHISKFEVTIERAQRPPRGTEFGDKISEPIESDYATVTGSFNFPETKNGVGGGQPLMSEQMNLTRYKADLSITSPNLAGAATEFFRHVLYFPDLQLQMEKGNIPGPEGPEQSVSFIAHHVGAIPTGFPAGYVDALTIENVNQDSANPLA